MVSRRLWMFAGALVAFGLPLAARLSRVGQPGRCASDGATIAPEYRVRLVQATGAQREFCDVACLTGWLDHNPSFSALFVTDELSRREVPADRAWLVRSSVVTHAATGNRTHCFEDHGDALRHARDARGKVLTAAEKPWAAAASQQARDG